MARYILDMSAVMATLYVLNLIIISVIGGYKVGPTIYISFNETPVLLFAEASKTTRSLVVELLSL